MQQTPGKNESDFGNIDSQNKKENEEESKKGHRRSKNDTEGRTYKCSQCGKSYLSYPALYTHCKTKHNTCNTSGRGRGRPKKENGEFNTERARYNPLEASYFLKENRKGTTTEFDEPIRNAFDMLYKNTPEIIDRNKLKLMKNYEKIEDHPFLGKFLKDSHDVNIKLENENEVSDLVFMDYLNKMSLHVNPTYFSRLIVFVTLFREYVNIAKKDQMISSDKEDTETTCAEDVPDLSNEFINEFLDPDKNAFNFNKEESIDLTQNICHWMYENNFTCSKLSLLNTDK